MRREIVKQDELRGTQLALVEAVGAEFDRVLGDIEPQIASKFGIADPAQAREAALINTAQNVLRTALEATFSKLVPYPERLPLELAVRLASYSISVLPVEVQEQATAAFLAAFPSAHRRRLAEGIRIDSEWMTEGRARPNFPKGDS
jgi:hypothetical protein